MPFINTKSTIETVAMPGTYHIKYTDPANPEITVDPLRYYPPVANSFPLRFVGYRYPQYGEVLWTNFLHLLENYANDQEPRGAVVGQLWFDTSVPPGQLKFYETNNSWQPVTAPVVAPVASFTKSAAAGVAPLSVAFTDTSANGPTSWLWTFGDGTTATTQNVAKSYAAAGTYSVTLKATNSAGTSTTAAQVITVTAAIITPVASFTKSVTSGVAPLSVTFTDTSTNGPTSWLWTFGDGTTATTQNPIKSYTVAGTYSATLKATNSAGASTTAAQVITVTAAVVAPVASFTKSTAAGVAPLSVTLTDTSTNGPTSWLWTFGDGTTSTTQNATKSYAAAGTYNVTLKATNSAGTSTTAAQVITVTAAVIIPVASFAKSTSSGVTPLSVTFTDTSTNSPTSWLWTFGDGTTSPVQSPTKSYATPGTYSVTLQVRNLAGSSTTAAQVITASAPVIVPVASFNKSAASGVAPLSVTFTDTSTNGPTSWLWTFGDGTTATTQNATKSYAAAGTYNATLKVTNSAGTSTTAAQVITVTEPVFMFDALLVGGGGGSGNNVAGGGGGGGASIASLSSAQQYQITVGAGGAGGAYNGYGSPGGTTSITSSGLGLTATGGLGGGHYYAGAKGGNSGSGNTGGPFSGSAGGGDWYGGAGAGAAQNGTGNGAAGGAGYLWSINGLRYGGGGGGANSAGWKPGGAGGGGIGGQRFSPPYATSGTNGLGGGGGGSSGNGGTTTGGSGVVIISYVGTTAKASGGTITTSGGRVFHTFTSSGTLTF